MGQRLFRWPLFTVWRRLGVRVRALARIERKLPHCSFNFSPTHRQNRQPKRERQGKGGYMPDNTAKIGRPSTPTQEIEGNRAGS